MSEPVPEAAYAPGDLVVTYLHDPPHHTRLPRYARGRRGVVVEPEERTPLPDVRSQGRDDAPVEMVYAVRFAARELWGEGDHDVVLDLPESYLRKADHDER
ncbi:nitrile hydratase subunit beta [Streptomyces sp. SID8379]|uniref:SH3-like domain-containing protein n=1 Tax=unclassified Streptomyces TaxID=2593676 RepID=UPI00039CEFD9|nr:SH3-like domain-containing protein [Streptomyces sp. HmicA12]MYW66098.1 nitrile hydratase subunit beta [Streptomyces sp. SID8379]